MAEDPIRVNDTLTWQAALIMNKEQGKMNKELRLPRRPVGLLAMTIFRPVGLLAMTIFRAFGLAMTEGPIRVNDTLTGQAD